MKITLGPLPSMQFAITAVLEEYDSSPPVEALLIDREPRKRNNDREALAGYLAFGTFAGSGLQLHRKASPATADAIRFDSVDRALMAHPIEYYPKALPIGSSSIVMTATPSAGFADRAELALVRSDRWNGAIATHRSLAVASNAFVLAMTTGVRAYLAVAVLLAEDLDADELVLEGWDVDAAEQSRLRALLGAVRLGVRFEGASA